MIYDAAMLLSGSVSANNVLTGQSLVGTGSILSANTVDIAPLALGGNQPGDFGVGENLFVEFGISATVTGGTSVQFQLIQADDAALTSNVQVISSTDALPIASLTLGQLIPLRWSPASPRPAKRYIGARYVIVGTNTAGAVTAGVVKDAVTTQQNYKSGYTVL